MRNFTNKDGELIEVSQEHLDVAVKIKVELQKASPSRRCQWSLHKKLMEEEGFFDSDTNESYRCLIKDYQKSIGELPSVEKYADMVSDNKLQSIRNLVGELSYEKRENQLYLRDINKGKRELIDFGILATEISEAFKNHDWSFLELDKVKYKSGGKTYMVVGLSDLHIGALVETDINTFNYDVAVSRLSLYLEKIIHMANERGVTDIHVVMMGDAIEHSSMRFNQGHEVEYVFSEQIPLVTDLIVKFISRLSKNEFNVSYAGFAGNHDRITDKDKNMDGDHVVNIINGGIKSFIENSGSNIKYIQAKDYSYVLSKYGKNIKFVHGDLDSCKDEELIAKHSKNDNIIYDAIIMGHFHHFRCIEVGYDKMMAIFGSLKGADNYGDRIRKINMASQGVILIDEDGTLDIKQIKLT